MSDNDPFAPGERTVIVKPTPGGARTRSIDEAGLAALEVQRAAPGPVQTTGLNPILDAATPLLAIGGQLRRSVQYDDTRELFRQLSQGVRKFNTDVQGKGEPADQTSIARYILCGFLDEAILNTPWGSDSDWGSHTLLAEFHNESSAGEKVFELLERMKPDPGRYLHLLELIYICLSLGFLGKYRRIARGADAVEEIRRDLFRLISRQRGLPERELSPSWRGAEDQRPRLTRYLPVWVFLAVAAGLMVVVFVVLLLRLETRSDPVVGEIAALGRNLEPVAARPAPAPSAVTLSTLLAARMGDGILDAGRHADEVVLRELFASGSPDVAPDHLALIADIATALQQLDGRVLITGHSDNVPIRSLRFPSNWQLSEARAFAVADILAANGIDRARLTAEPRADTEPVCADCDQDEPAQRALNRRVEIELLGGAGRL